MLLRYFLLGAVSGFFSSTPLGPINFWVADHKLSRSKNSLLIFFLVAVILVDITFAGLALWGHFDLLEETQEMRLTGIISGTFTAILGLILFIKALKPTFHQVSAHQGRGVHAFIQGLILTGLNPAFIIFWLFVANQIMANLDQHLTPLELTFFLSGVISGDLVWFSFFSLILTHLKKRTQENTLRRLRISVGLVIMLLGLIGIGRYVY